MSLRIIGSLSEFKEKTSWPFYYYAEELKKRGFHPNFIEVFLRKLSRDVPQGADPDQVLQSFIKEHDVDFSLDPYQYERPENIMGNWHQYYKERPERFKKEFNVPFDLSKFELDDLIHESRSWGSKFYPVVDHLSNGLKMVKLTDEQEMKTCGNDLSVCIGNGGGSTVRSEALSGERELWALKDKYDNVLAIASVFISPEGERRIEEIRGYKNRGYIYQGHEGPIREWMEKHPEYIDDSKYMTNREELEGDGDAAYDVRGFYGDDDPDDWSEEYKELFGNGNPKDLIIGDISNLNRYLYEVIEDSDFIKKLIPEIIDGSHNIDKDTLTSIFDKYPEYAENALDIFINENDGGTKLVEVFFENETTNKTIKDFVIDHYCSDNFDEEWIHWDRPQLVFVYNYYLLPEEKKQMKNKAIKFFNQYSIIEDYDKYFELDFTFNNEEKDIYITNLYKRITEEIKQFGDLIKEEDINDFIYELRVNYKYVDIQNYDFIFDLIKNSYILSKNTENLDLFMKDILKDKSKDFLVEEILPIADDEKTFYNIIYSFKKHSAFKNFLDINDPKAKEIIEKTKNDFEYIKKILSKAPTSLKDNDEFYSDLLSLFSYQQLNPNIESMLIEMSNIYPINFFKLLSVSFHIYGMQNLKNIILNILYSKYGFEKVNKTIIDTIGELEYNALKKSKLIKESFLKNKMVKLLTKIDLKIPNIADNIEKVFKNELYRNIKR